MANLSNAVAKTMNFVFADIENATNEKKKRLSSLRANIGKVVNISPEEITTDENIRKSIDVESESFLRLVESIKRYGILENIVAELRVNPGEKDYKLVCIAGHRRILAAKIAGNINKVPCLLQSYQEKGDHIGAALAENLNREDLHGLDIAEGYQELIACGWSEDELAKHFCRDIRTIKHYLKIASWPKDIKKIVRENAQVFSTRVLMRQFAYRKFANSAALKTAINHVLNPKAKKKKTPVKVAGAQAKGKEEIRARLDHYLNDDKLLISDVIKDEIIKAFTSLELI